jgi:ABC-type multidrug transport system ATPase subunit
MEYILKTHDLTKKYGETLAVNAVNMTIERGDIYGCVGENGAGKSTLIRLITGIAKPTRGSFQLFKQDRLGASRRWSKPLRSIYRSPRSRILPINAACLV